MNTEHSDRRRLLLSALMGLVLPAAAGAAEDAVQVEGQSFERRVQLAGADLQLNGTGVRSVAWLKGFAAGLYLSSAAHTVAQVMSTSGPKRLRMRMLLDVPAEEFAKAFRKGVARNTAGAEAVQALESRMASFEARVQALGKVRKGDVIDLDLDPARGTSLVVNGTLRGVPIAGEDFYLALLRAFIGEQPYDEKLRAGLLGQAS